MSLLTRLMPRAGHVTASSVRPKGMPQPSSHQMTSPLSRMEDEEAHPMRREEQEEQAAPLRRQDEDQADLSREAAAPDETLPLHRTPEEDLQPMRRSTEEEAQPLHRLEEPEETESVQALHRMEESEEADAQALRPMAPPNATMQPNVSRTDTPDEPEAAPMMRMDEDLQPLRRASSSDLSRAEIQDDTPMPPDAPPHTPIPDLEETPPAMALHREMTPSAISSAVSNTPNTPVTPEAINAPAPAPAPEATPTPQPEQPHPTFEQSLPDLHDAPPTFDPSQQTGSDIPEGPAKVVIDQVDVVIQEPARAAQPASPSHDLSAMARRRYLGGI